MLARVNSLDRPAGRPALSDAAEPKASHGKTALDGDVLRHGRALPPRARAGHRLHAIDVFVISTVMPAVVREIGGAGFYAWATMVYMVASIMGAASAEPLRARLGAAPRLRRWPGCCSSAAAAAAAVSPTMLVLLLARAVQGFGGGSAVVAVDGADRRPSTRARCAPASWRWSPASGASPRCSGLWSAACSREIGWWRGAFLVDLAVVSPASPSSPGAQVRSAAATPARRLFPSAAARPAGRRVIWSGIASHLDSGSAVQAGLLALAVVAVGLARPDDAVQPIACSPRIRCRCLGRSGSRTGCSSCRSIVIPRSTSACR